mmetsp:Transcript_141467/g.260701  ORF Transcript_141467/g.260701 Transcript_141467/m.260701 type:complete len:80 (+) Transcript_141467:47-286(+)
MNQIMNKEEGACLRNLDLRRSCVAPSHLKMRFCLFNEILPQKVWAAAKTNRSNAHAAVENTAVQYALRPMGLLDKLKIC